MSEQVTPGINPMVKLRNFTSEEIQIIERISKDWYVTNGGDQISLGATSSYRYLLIKPIDIFQEMFNIDREIIVIFSQYSNFEPRTLDAIAIATRAFQNLRIERICSVVISKDDKIEQKIVDLLKNDQEAQIVIPFSYSELLQPLDSYYFRNRFKKHFFSRDLFASEAPLKKDLYFFGRNDLVHSLVNRHRSNQVSGLFGLRKTGKTSVIFGVQRALERNNSKSVFIDCQNPGFHRRRWDKALHYVLCEIKTQLMVNVKINEESDFIDEKASSLFETTIKKINKEVGKTNILLIFDEIENITPSVSPSEHWKDGLDFVYFWQTLRSLFQKLSEVFSFLIVGTNPLCVELERINGADNPIFGQIPLEYISGFDVPQTREMIRRLGRIMGLQFDEIIYGKLTEDFGGHPYLMRHVCSVINKICPSERPVRIDKTIYEEAKKSFLKDYSHFLDMILNVLKEYFEDEYEMLTYLARGDYKTFNDLALLSALYTNHLVGYGILSSNNGKYSFKIEAIREHLLVKYKFKKLHLTQEEKRAEISERRNAIEPKLRLLCRQQLKSYYGEADARAKVLDIMGEPRKTRNGGLSYSKLFDGNVSGLLFSDFEKLINKYWDCFKNLLGPDKQELLRSLDNINKLRVDAHAKTITTEEMQLFRLCADKFETLLNEHFV